MYFHDRAQAGKLLAEKLKPYQIQNTAVVALSRGGLMVGAQIALKLHASLMMLLTENIDLPGLQDPFAAVSPENTITYNKSFYSGEREELTMEYFHQIEQQRIEKIHRLHTLTDGSGQVRKDLLKNHIVILVNDGFSTGFSLDVAADYLKPVKAKKLIVAAAVASMSAMDRMRLFGDEVACLSVAQNYIDTDHYFDENQIPSTEGLFKIIRNISLSWDSDQYVSDKKHKVSDIR
jgi:predicted phosphoribosyltransferase